MQLKIKSKTLIVLVLLIFLVGTSYGLYQYFKPVKTIFFRGVAFSFRQDVRKALEVDIFPHEELLYDLFRDFDIKNVTILFKPGTPETNALYQLQAIELAYKLSRYDELTRTFFRPKKVFDAREIDTYDNITREHSVLKIILAPPEFSNETRVVGGGNKIWIYGKTEKEFDLAVEKAILSLMNITTTQGYV
jgi:hypothetical protein